jgi:hypothetical protein
MHSITIRLKRMVQKPLQLQKMATGILTKYNIRHVTSNNTLVTRLKVHSRTQKLAEPRDVSILVPMVGKNKHMRTIVMRLLPTRGERIIRYTSKWKILKKGVFESATSSEKKKEKMYTACVHNIIIKVHQPPHANTTNIHEGKKQDLQI